MKKVFLMVIFLICGLYGLQAQKSVPDSTFEKHYLITADVAGGGNLIVVPYVNVMAGVGMQYNFREHCGVAAGLRYLAVIPTRNFSVHYMLFPLEIEYHVRHFYLRGGIILGVGLNACVADNAKDILLLGGTIGLGGRIPLKSHDNLTIGIHYDVEEAFGLIYRTDNNKASRHFTSNVPRGSVVLKIRYEHRF